MWTLNQIQQRVMGSLELTCGMLVWMGVACDEAQQVHTLKMDVSTPEGKTNSYKIKERSSWDYDSLGVAFAAWPHASEFSEVMEVGLMVDFYPWQPGTYLSNNAFLVLDGITYGQQGSLSLVDQQSHFTGNGNFPFEAEGRVEGIVEGHTISGEWDISNDNCGNDVVAGAGCGFNFPTADMVEQVWEVTSYSSYGPCPQELVDRYFDGNQITIGPKGAHMGKGDGLECVLTEPEVYKAICGTDDTVKIDGCTWAVTAVAWPGNSYLGNTPAFGILAGTLGSDCEPQTCSHIAASFTPVSGTGL